MPGYANNPAATAEAFFGDWFRTGDRGVLRDGYLYLEGRLKEMILRGGENISPAEIEQVLLSHPGGARRGLLRRRRREVRRARLGRRHADGGRGRGRTRA